MISYAQNGIWRLLAGVALWLGSYCPLVAAGTISLQLENDSFDGASDAYYTQGFRLAFTPDAPTEWPEKYLPFVTTSDEIRSQYFIGQAIFTPYEIGEAQLIEDDRPYAGWLYLGAALLSERLKPQSRLKVVQRVELSAGIVGPSSAAGRVQRWTHRMTGTYEVNGWQNQLHDEPALMASYIRKWAYARPLGQSGIDWGGSAILGGSVGNVSTQAVSGMGIRVGTNLLSSVAINSISPGTVTPDHGPVSVGKGWYLFSEWQLRFVARDIFLDGNSDKESHSVEKEPRVGDWRLGVVFSTGRYQWTLYHSRRSREFETQYENASFSGVGLTSRF